MSPEGQRDMSVLDPFRMQVRRAPDQLAVAGSRGTLTYGALDIAAAALGGRLSRHVADSGAPVGLLLDHGADALIGAFGTLAAGGIVMPIDADDAPGRVRALLTHAGAAVVVVRAARLRDLGEAVPPGVSIVTLEEALSARAVPQDDRARPRGDAPAWLYQTSGSTGQPKLVAVSHRTLTHAVAGNRQRLDLGPADRFTWFALPSTSQGGSNILGALYSGGTLYPHHPRADGLTGIGELLRRERITVYNSSATLFRAIVATLGPDDRFPDLRVLRVGSEPVRRADVEAYRRHCPPACIFVNRYSSTETGNITLQRIAHDGEFDGDTIPVGTPMPGKRVLIVDESGASLEPGETGEIVVQSAHLSLGYWNDQGATDARFREAADAPGERLYFTGDRGRLRADGTLEHLGRLDRQAKVRGQRIDLDLIEAALADHPAVQHAVALVEPGPSDEARVVGAVVLHVGAHLTAAALRAFLLSRLPAPAIPSTVGVLPALALTPTGKPDRAASWRSARPLPDDGTTVPFTSAVERDLAAIWAEVLGVPVASAAADFLDAGGDSLQGLRVLARIERRWKVEVSFEELLDNGTVAALAALVSERLHG